MFCDPASLVQSPSGRFQGVPEACARLHANFGEARQTLANFGEPSTPYSQEPARHSPEFRRRSPTFTRVPAKVPSVCGWPSECGQLQKPLSPGNTIKCWKCKIPHPGWAPKRRDKNTEKKHVNVPKLTIFALFQIFFRIFAAQGGCPLPFFVVFSDFWDSGL